MSNYTINVVYSSTSSFVPSAPSQRQFALDTTNNNYIRNATLTQDSLTLTYYTSSVIFPLQNLYQVAVGVNPILGWPPVITQQPTSSAVVHPSQSFFAISASGANNTPLTYQWYSQSYSQSLTSSTAYFPLTNSVEYSGCTASLLSWNTSSLAGLSSSYYCVVSCSSGVTTSSVVQWYVS
jgi:hypothetical protein